MGGCVGNERRMGSELHVAAAAHPPTNQALVQHAVHELFRLLVGERLRLHLHYAHHGGAGVGEARLARLEQPPVQLHVARLSAQALQFVVVVVVGGGR